MRRTGLWKDMAGASAAEFALVLPLLLILLFGIIDGGRLLWTVNRAEKAAQAGVRAAVVTDILPGGFVGYSYVGQVVDGVTLTQGDRIPAGALTRMTCTSSGCACATGGTCPPAGTFNTDSFNRILARIQDLYPEVDAANVAVDYTGSGLGYAGDPNGMDLAPVVSVRITGMQFQPLTGFMLATFTLPDFRSSLTAEDSVGTQFN